MARQLRLLKDQDSYFGGMLLKKSHAKTARPLHTRRPIHLVLKSEMATGSRSLLAPKNVDKVREILSRHAGKCGIKAYHFANGGNHLHLVVRIHSVREFRRFIRAVTGLIARHVLNAQRGSRKLKDKGFWIARPFTRVAHWGRDYERLAKYILINNLEALGFIPHQSRSNTKSRDEIISIKVEPEP